MQNGCGLDEEDYLAQSQKLLPPGPAWSREPDSLITKLLRAAARAWSRIGARACVLASEANPLYADELLASRLQEAGVPDACSSDDATLGELRDQMLAKWRGRGGQSAAYYTELAEAAGFEICVREYEPFCAGSGAGDPLSNDPWDYVFRIGSADNSITFEFGAGDAAGEPLRNWGNDRLECLINRYKPAHTLAVFTYGDDVCE